MAGHSRAPSIPSIAGSALTVNGNQSVAAGGPVSISGAASVISATESEVFGSVTEAGSIASLVYNGTSDPRGAGYKTPTTRDIPQVKLPRVEPPVEDVVEKYLQAASTVPENIAEPKNSDLPALDTVPEIFLADGFELDNPRVFDIVTGRDENSDEGPGEEMLLYDKLSWYVDIVEMHLIAEIAKASGSFFSATASFHDIEQRASSLGEEIRNFRSQVVEIREGVYSNNVETLAIRKKSAELDKLTAAMEFIKEFTDGMQKLRLSLKSGVDEAQSQVEYLKKLLSLENPPIKLQSLRAIASLLDELDTAEEYIHEHYTALIASNIIDDIRDYVRKEEANIIPDLFTKVLPGGHSAPSSGPPQALPEGLVSTIETALKALTNAPEAIRVIDDQISREIKSIIRGCLPALDTEDVQLARSLHYLDAQAAEEMCMTLFSRVIAALRRIKLHQNLLVNNVPCAESGSILADAVMSADSRLVRVLKVRKDSTAVLHPTMFARFFALTDTFVRECEQITGIWPPEIGEFEVVQTQLYMHTFHNSNRQNLEESLDSDNWRREEIPGYLQGVIDKILECGSLDPTSWIEQTKLNKKIDDLSTGVDDGQSDPAKKCTSVYVDGDSMYISRGTISTIRNIGRYALLICLLPSRFSSDFCVLLGDFLTEYNGKVRSLILGFGATRTAGLKHISVRHLALASESLRCVEKLLLSIVKLSERHVSRDRMDETTAQIQYVVRTLSEHQAEIHRKLVKLMADKITVSCRNIAVTDWSKSPQDENEEANKYMRDLVKDTQTVVRILEDVMPASIAVKIVSEVFAAYKTRLLDAYCRVRIRSQREKDSILADLEYFRIKAGSLSGAGNVADVVYESVNNFVSPDNTSDATTDRFGSPNPRSRSRSPVPPVSRPSNDSRASDAMESSDSDDKPLSLVKNKISDLNISNGSHASVSTPVLPPPLESSPEGDLTADLTMEFKEIHDNEKSPVRPLPASENDLKTSSNPRSPIANSGLAARLSTVLSSNAVMRDNIVDSMPPPTEFIEPVVSSPMKGNADVSHDQGSDRRSDENLATANGSETLLEPQSEEQAEVYDDTVHDEDRDNSKTNNSTIKSCTPADAPDVAHDGDAHRETVANYSLPEETKTSSTNKDADTSEPEGPTKVKGENGSHNTDDKKAQDLPDVEEKVPHTSVSENGDASKPKQGGGSGSNRGKKKNNKRKGKKK